MSREIAFQYQQIDRQDGANNRKNGIRFTDEMCELNLKCQCNLPNKYTISIKTATGPVFSIKSNRERTDHRLVLMRFESYARHAFSFLFFK